MTSDGGMLDADFWRPLLSTDGALSHTATRICVGIAGVAVVGMLAAGPLVARKASPEIAKDIRVRTWTWAILAPLTFAAILIAPVTLILFAGALGLLCHREFAKATGLFRERLTSAVVAAGILFVTGSVLGHADLITQALGQAMVLVALCVLNVLPDQPAGYIRRVALGAASFMLFGIGLSRLGLFAHDREYRAIVCVIVTCVQLNDVFAYCCGRLLGARFGHAKWFVHTSPGKTIAGHVGALVLTVPLAAWLLSMALAGTPLASPAHLIALACIISIGGQFGDLVISSVKRDVGVKDMGTILPGHGGVLDRCNSLLLAVPIAYHYIHYFGV